MTDIHYCKSKKIDLGKLAQDFQEVSNRRSDSTQNVGESKKMEADPDSLQKKIEYNPFHIQNHQHYNPV